MNVDVQLVRQWIHEFSNKTMAISGMVTLLKIGKLQADSVQLDKLDAKTNELINALNNARTELVSQIQAHESNRNVLYELTYISEMNLAICTRTPSEIVDDINKYAEPNNKREGIAGFLFCCNGYFLQRLEGQKDAIFKMMGKIAADPRHKNISVLSSGETINGNQKRWDSMLCAVPMDEKIRSNIAQLIAVSKGSLEPEKAPTLLHLLNEYANNRDAL